MDQSLLCYKTVSQLTYIARYRSLIVMLHFSYVMEFDN